MNRAELLHKKNFPPEGQTRQANCPHSPSICLAARCPVSSPLNEIPAMLDMIDLNLELYYSPYPTPEWLFYKCSNLIIVTVQNMLTKPVSYKVTSKFQLCIIEPQLKNPVVEYVI